MVEYKGYIKRIIKLFSKIKLELPCERSEAYKILEKVFIEYGNKKNYENPRVGIAVIIEKDNKVLLIKRKNSIGHDKWAFPGGKMEKYESIEETSIRETKEEVDLDISNITIDSKVTNDIWKDHDKHFITLYVKCDFKGEPKNKEKNKCSDIGWFDWDNLPDNLFLPLINYLKK